MITLNSAPGQKPLVPPAILWLSLGLGLTLSSTLFGWFAEAIAAQPASLFVENGWIETSEAVLLVLMAGLFTVRALRRHDAIALCCTLVAFCAVLMAVREVPRCDSSFFEGGFCLNRFWKNTATAATTFILAASIVFHRSALEWRSAFATALSFWPLAVSVGLVLLGALAEWQHHVGIEESLELAAYLNAVLLGVRMLRIS